MKLMTKQISSMLPSSQHAVGASTAVMNSLISNISGIVSNKLSLNPLELNRGIEFEFESESAITRNNNITKAVMPYYYPAPTTTIFTILRPSFFDTNPTATIAVENLNEVQVSSGIEELDHNSSSQEEMTKNLSIWLISTLKRRKKKMNKHKLRKRRKLLRLKSKK